MCVVPLAVDISVVEKQEDFDSKGHKILVTNLESEQLRSDTSSNVSYDLRVGHEYRRYRDRNKTELGETDSIIIRPGDTVMIQTEEAVHMPSHLFAYIVPKVTLLNMGLTNTLAKVDPGYPGSLVVTIFNLGKTTQKLSRRAPFCQMVVHTVLEGATLYHKGSKQVAGAPRRPGWWLRADAWVDRHKTLLTLLSGGLGGALVNLLVQWLGRMHGH